MEKQLFMDKINQLESIMQNKSVMDMHSQFKQNSKSEAVISFRQFHILHVIKKYNINTNTDIAKFFRLSKSNISIITSKMINNNLIKKVDNDCGDNRVTNFALTQEGELQYKEHFEGIEQIFETVIPEFDEGIIDATHSIINDFNKALGTSVTYESWVDNFILIMVGMSTFIETMFSKLEIMIDGKLTQHQLRILLMMTCQCDTIDEISEGVGVSHSTLSIQLKTLIQKGYVVSVPNLMDKRKKTFEVTDKATKFLDEVDKMKNQIIVDTILEEDEDTQKITLSIVDNLLYIFTYQKNQLEKENTKNE